KILFFYLEHRSISASHVNGNFYSKSHSSQDLDITFVLELKCRYIHYWTGSSFSLSYESTAFKSRFDFLINREDIEPEINASIIRSILTCSNSFIILLKNCSAASSRTFQ